jgi:Holliday junction resolvase RusA-like endonuclease
VAVPPKEREVRKALGIGPLAGDPGPRRRRVAVRVANPHYRGRNVPDPLSPLKSLLDALVQAGLLVDDSERWCEIVVPVKYVSGEKSTTIFLEDL